MKFFRYMVIVECMVIISIFVFYKDREVDLELFRFFEAYFPRDSWVSSQIYYEITKITSSLMTICIAINIIYLLIWFSFFYKKEVESKEDKSAYDIEEKHIIVMIVFGGWFVVNHYLSSFMLVSHYKSRMIPMDGFYSSVIFSIAMLLSATLLGFSSIMGMRCLFYKIFRK